MTKKEQNRYRVICRQLFRLREQGYNVTNHPDIEILEAELAGLGDKFIKSRDVST